MDTQWKFWKQCRYLIGMFVISAALLAACTGSAAPAVSAAPTDRAAPTGRAVSTATSAPAAAAEPSATSTTAPGGAVNSVPATGTQSTAAPTPSATAAVTVQPTATTAAAAVSATATAPAAVSTPQAGLSGGTGNNGAVPAGPVGDPAAKQAVVNALQAYQKAGPYRVESTITANGKTEQMTSEVILPDRFHLKMPTMELLAVGSKTYVKQGDKWVSFPMDIGGFLSGFTASVNQDLINGMSNFKIVGPDVINGAPAMVYQFDSTYGAGNQSVTSVDKLWVDIARGLPVKQEITGSAGGVQSTTVQIITFDPNIKIEPPQ